MHAEKIHSPAKINLHLHILGKTENNYHTLDSLVCFVKLSDTLTFSNASNLSLDISGPFADQLNSLTTLQDNLILKAITELEKISKTAIHQKISLHKNIPLGAGLGGGSSNAAKTLQEIQKIYKTNIDLKTITEKLGSDITACLSAPAPVIMRGTGNTILNAPILPSNIPVLLVNAGQHCATPEIYRALNMAQYNRPATFPPRFKTIQDLTAFLDNKTSNDLTEPALKTNPTIQKTLDSISSQPECLLSRLSGSGATCFGIFPSDEWAQIAANKIKTTHPDWWVVKTNIL